MESGIFLVLFLSGSGYHTVDGFVTTFPKMTRLAILVMPQTHVTGSTKYRGHDPDTSFKKLRKFSKNRLTLDYELFTSL